MGDVFKAFVKQQKKIHKNSPVPESDMDNSYKLNADASRPDRYDSDLLEEPKQDVQKLRMIMQSLSMKEERTVTLVWTKNHTLFAVILRPDKWNFPGLERKSNQMPCVSAIFSQSFLHRVAAYVGSCQRFCIA